MTDVATRHVSPSETALNETSRSLDSPSPERLKALEAELADSKNIEASLRSALRDEARAVEELRAILEQEKDARARAERSDSLKEVFLGILGHDLRNPLNTVLTTARLMTMRNELAPESQRRIERIITSGVRMQRMLEQIDDVTRARLTGGISVDRGDPRDLAPLVAKIVEEVRAAKPALKIELHATACVASVDPDRFEQMVSNVLGNAAVHGDTSQAIRVDLLARDRSAVLTVHNHGPAMSSELKARLFDPFKHAAGVQCRAPGLGLGLYICELIVTAHGGTIEVESSAELGTQVRVALPAA